MDIATIIGATLGIGLIAFAVILHNGVKGLLMFNNTEAFLVVLGGTFCATMVNYPLSQIISVFKVAKNALFTHSINTQAVVAEFVNLSKKARREGIISLEGDLRRLDNDFMRRGLQMVIDGQDQDFVRTMLETEIGFLKERHKVGQEVFWALGTYAPAFGIIGTVLGMILMLHSITDVEQVPARMAVALTSAFYGLGAGYLLFMPIAGKLRRRSEEELFVNEIIIRGVLLLQGGVSPRLIEAGLNAFLNPAQRLSAAVLKK